MMEEFNSEWNNLYYEYSGTDDMLNGIYTSGTGFPPEFTPHLMRGGNDIKGKNLMLNEVKSSFAGNFMTL
jgi:hypothetical protein